MKKLVIFSLSVSIYFENQIRLHKERKGLKYDKYGL